MTMLFDCRLPRYRQVSTRSSSYSKLSPTFYGPFKVIEKIGPMAYRLKLPPGAHIHNVFYVSKLKPFHGEPPTIFTLPPELVEGWP